MPLIISTTTLPSRITGRTNVLVISSPCCVLCTVSCVQNILKSIFTTNQHYAIIINVRCNPSLFGMFCALGSTSLDKYTP